MTRVATDIGGTFTDLVYVTKDGQVGTAKSHTTPAYFEQEVIDVVQAGSIDPRDFTAFVHGTTIYTVEQSARSAGYPVIVLVVDLVESGQGGGSLAWVDAFNRLHVGPQSAGAEPGLVAYGRVL